MNKKNNNEVKQHVSYMDKILIVNFSYLSRFGHTNNTWRSQINYITFVCKKDLYIVIKEYALDIRIRYEFLVNLSEYVLFYNRKLIPYFSLFTVNTKTFRFDCFCLTKVTINVEIL